MQTGANTHVSITSGQLSSRERQLAGLKPFRKGDGRAQVARAKVRKDKIISKALLAKLVRKRAMSIAESLIQQAEKGSVFAFKELADRTEGKVADRLEVSGNVDLGLRIAAARKRIAANSDAPSIDIPAERLPESSEPDVIDLDSAFHSESK